MSVAESEMKMSPSRLKARTTGRDFMRPATPTVVWRVCRSSLNIFPAFFAGTP